MEDVKTEIMRDSSNVSSTRPRRSVSLCTDLVFKTGIEIKSPTFLQIFTIFPKKLWGKKVNFYPKNFIFLFKTKHGNCRMKRLFEYFILIFWVCYSMASLSDMSFNMTEGEQALCLQRQGWDRCCPLKLIFWICLCSFFIFIHWSKRAHEVEVKAWSINLNLIPL